MSRSCRWSSIAVFLLLTSTASSDAAEAADSIHAWDVFELEMTGEKELGIGRWFRCWSGPRQVFRRAPVQCLWASSRRVTSDDRRSQTLRLPNSSCIRSCPLSYLEASRRIVFGGSLVQKSRSPGNPASS